MPSVELQPTSTPDTKALSADLDLMLQNLAQAHAFSGSALVAQNGQVILKNGYGYADREQDIPNTPETRFRICSITKQFTAMAILILQEQGRLNLQDSICTHLGNCPEVWEPVTIYQLLTHTSGIPDPLEAFWTQNITSPAPLERMIAEASSQPLNFQPGTQFSYDNTGYDLLGKIIEAASGQSYEEFLQKNIFEPLEMKDTGFDPGREDIAVGYADQSKTIAQPFNIWVAFSAGGLYSTVEDLYLWDRALYTQKLVPQRILNEMFTAHFSMPDGSGMGYGYGWVIAPETQRKFVAHEGSAYGYRSVIIRYLDNQAAIILLINQENIDPNVIADLIAQKLFREK
jgi:CubicO group peptidase (beta-lactamase class C family)